MLPRKPNKAARQERLLSLVRSSLLASPLGHSRDQLGNRVLRLISLQLVGVVGDPVHECEGPSWSPWLVFAEFAIRSLANHQTSIA